jgi:hypothetical protein
VDVDVEIERRAEALDDGDGAAAPIDDAVHPRALAQEPQNRSQIDGHDRAT